MSVDILQPRKIPFIYTSPPVCEYIFSASGETEIFLNDRSPATGVTGLEVVQDGDSYRLQWDALTGALCYSVYRTVSELDSVLVAECITDHFYDTSVTGTYFVTAVTDDGETPPSDSIVVGATP